MEINKDIKISGKRLKFDKYAKYGAYHWSAIKRGSKEFSLPLRARYSKILEAVSVDAKVVVEIGCGDGALTYLLKQHVKGSVLGCDLDQKGITLAKQEIEKHNGGNSLRIECKEFASCELESGSVDVVILGDVIEHISKPYELLQEIKRVGKPGGCLVMTTPKKRKGKPWDAYHLCEYTEETLGILLKELFPNTAIYPFMPISFYKCYNLTPMRCAFNVLSRIGLNVFKMRLKGMNHAMLLSISIF